VPVRFQASASRPCNCAASAEMVLEGRLAFFTQTYPDVVLEDSVNDGFVDVVKPGKAKDPGRSTRSSLHRVAPDCQWVLYIGGSSKRVEGL
jgi:hypothetical protein